MLKRTRLFSAILPGVAILAASCASPSEGPPAKREAAVPVRTDRVQKTRFAVGYRASGTVRGHATATLTSKSVGHVRAVHVRSGDLVREGQLLVELEASDVLASVSGARAALASAVASKLEAESALTATVAAAKLAQSNHQRSSRLLEQQVIAQEQYDQSEAQASSAVAQEQAARARLSAADSAIQQATATLAESRAMLGYTKLTAPFNGRVLERLIDPGALASPGTPLLVVADDGKLRVESAVPESRAAEVKVGGAASIEVEGVSAPLAGKIGEIVASVDTASRAFLVKVDLPDGAPHLRPGTFARVTFPLGDEPRLVVPTEALTRFGALERVFVVERGEARLRMITTGEAQATWTAVLSGLTEGERIVVSPPASLRDRDAVEVVP
jgi:RND family efflux transporter MFP subunit